MRRLGSPKNYEVILWGEEEPCDRQSEVLVFNKTSLSIGMCADEFRVTHVALLRSFAMIRKIFLFLIQKFDDAFEDAVGYFFLIVFVD